MKLNPKQKPLGTKWGFSTTAQEIVDYYQPEGKTIVVTGGYSGIGEIITKALSQHNQVIVPARRPEIANEKFADQPNVTVMPMDLADLNSIDKFAAALHEKISKLDLLINNAGIMATPEKK